MRDALFYTYMHACNRRVLASSRRASEQACGNLARIARKIIVQGWRPSSARLQHQPNKELGFGNAVPGIMPKNSAVLKETSSSSSSSNNNNTTCDRIAEHWRASLRSRMQVLIQQHSNERTSTITACAFASQP